MRVICALYEAAKSDGKERMTYIDKRVKAVMRFSGQSLGVNWDSGVFYPSGDKVLDKELINSSLQFLNKYPDERKDLLNALKDHNQGNEKDVVTNCYTAIEGLARKVLGNDKRLDKNREDLLK